MSHIHYDTWYYQEDYIREYTEEGEPVFDHHDVGVDQAYCGKEDYSGILYFAADPAEADCPECIDAFALGVLADLP